MINFAGRGFLGFHTHGRFAPSHIWLLPGVLWFLLGIAWASSNKVYQQGLVIFFWLPALLIAILSWERFRSLWLENRAAVSGLLLLACWSALSTFWGSAEEPLREAKRILYVLLLLGGLILVAGNRPQSYITLLQVAGYGLALAALVALIQSYGWEGKSWRWRLSGIGLLDHPIMGGYVTGIAAVWLLLLPPRGIIQRLLWGGSLAVMLAFLVMTQSRGVWIALLTVILLLPLWRNNRFVWGLGALLLIAGAIGYWQFESIVTARGASYRPEILMASLQMVAERPWLGIGLGSEYSIVVESLGLAFDHSHNVFTHVALELGIPGLLAWLFLWGWCVQVAWRERRTRLGGALLGMLLFSSWALLFDGANLWDTPRPEWFLTWLPVGLTLGLRSFTGQLGCYPINRTQRPPHEQH